MPKKKKIKEYNSISRMREMLKVLREYGVVHGLSPLKLRLMLDALGPTFVKLGQILSMRSDILPAEYCTELRKLRSAAAVMSIREVEKQLSEEYGEHWGTRFREVSQTPLGSASIAQVHSAVLTDGRRVALKIQRPRVREKMAEDIVLFKRALKIMDVFSKIGDIVDFNMLLDEIWEAAKQEMDFIAEAAHLEKFQKLNAEIKYVSCPVVYTELSTEKVLVMDFVEGVPIDETERLAENGYDIRDIAKKLAENYIKQILEDGFFHADPHPGNIRISDGKIIWLDLGMMGVLSPRDRDLFRKAVLAIVNNDVYELEMTLLTIGGREGAVSHSELYEDITLFLMKYGSANFSELEFSKVMSDLMDITGRHHITMPPGITMLTRGMMTMEGVLSFCYPETSLIEILSSHFNEMSMNRSDVSNEILTFLKKLYAAAGKSAEMPGYLADILKMSARGQAKLNLGFPGAEGFLGEASAIINRLIIGIVDAALLVSSSLICMTDISPRIMGIPWPGLIGYAAATLLSGFLILSCRRSAKKR